MEWHVLPLCVAIFEPISRTLWLINPKLLMLLLILSSASKLLLLQRHFSPITTPHGVWREKDLSWEEEEAIRWNSWDENFKFSNRHIFQKGVKKFVWLLFLKRREGGPKGWPSEASLNFFLESWLFLKHKSRINREKFEGSNLLRLLLDWKSRNLSVSRNPQVA